MYLHENKENFREMIELVSDDTGRAAAVIEKDYYVTLVLRLLSEQLSNVVFKGGTSLSKGYHVINRFSEDIDITFDEHIGEARRKKLKNQILKGISEELCMRSATGRIRRVTEITMRIILLTNQYGIWKMTECCPR